MTRLAYGLLCSQSGAQFCLRRAISNNETAAAPETLELALRSFYVDDLLTSVPASSELLKFFKEITALLEFFRYASLVPTVRCYFRKFLERIWLLRLCHSILIKIAMSPINL